MSLRRFQSERWWERKVQAYEKIIGALHDSKAFADNHLEAGYRGRELPEEKDKELQARSKVAHEEIAKACGVHRVTISRTFAKWRKTDDYFDFITQNY